MKKLDDRALANMEVALEDACKRFPNGGDHESRRHVARKLMQSAKKGNTTLGELSAVADGALRELLKRQSV
jgi:hypothetical protein